MTDTPYRKFLCRVCGFVYDEAKGDPDGGLAPGTRYEDIPDDWTCPLCGVSKVDLVLIQDRPPVTAAAARAGTAGRAGGGDAIVIVGAGIAGWSAAERLRQRLPDRPITLVSACDAHVYSKPSLSLAISSHRTPDQLVEQNGAARAKALDITLRSNSRALRIDSRRKRLLTTRGSIAYGQLVLALGARQIELPIDGDGANDVVRVNDLQEYRALRQRLERNVDHVTIIGAGLIGCEFADDLCRGGFRVTLLDRASGLLPRLLPPKMAAQLQSRMAASGTRFIGGSEVKNIQRHHDGYRLHLGDGRTLDSDLVLSAVGLAPQLQLARKAGLQTGLGIQVRADDLRTSVPDIYALGDCAEIGGTVYSYIEPIVRQAETLAAALAGDTAPFISRPPLVRIKTPSLTLAVYLAPGVTVNGPWHTVREEAAGCHVQCHIDGVTRGFVLSGTYAQQADRLYAQLHPASQRTDPTPLPRAARA